MHLVKPVDVDDLMEALTKAAPGLNRAGQSEDWHVVGNER